MGRVARIGRGSRGRPHVQGSTGSTGAGPEVFSYYVAKSSNGGADTNAGTLANPFATLNHGVTFLGPGVSLGVRAGTYPEALISNIPSGIDFTSTGKVRIAAYTGETVWLAPTGPRVLEFGVGSTQQYIEIERINLDATGCDNDVAKFYGYSTIGNATHIRLQNAEVLTTLSTVGSGSAVPQTILSATDNAALGADLQFRYLTVHGGNAGANDFGPHGFYMNGSDALIEHCEIYDIGGNAIQVYNGNGGQSNRATIRYNIIHDINRAQVGGSTVDTGGRHRGVAVAGGTGTRIYNNIFYNIEGTETVGPTEKLSGAIEVSFATNTEIYFNTIYNCQKGIKLDGVTNQDSIVRDNIIFGSSITDYQDDASTTTQDHNIIGSDPSFVNAAAHNFHLSTGSVASGAGVASTYVTDDYDAVARGNPPDCGAYEVA